jgi:hypothetical protein
MKYIKVIDKCEADVECIFYFEVDFDMYEVRKVELYNAALLGFASSDISFNGTELSKTKLFEASEINKISGMAAIEIENADFEEIWQQAVSALND